MSTTEQSSERISEAELSIECGERVKRFSEKEGASCFVLITYTTDESLEQRLESCASRYMEVASSEEGGRAVFIVGKLDMLTLSICDSLCIPLVMGGVDGPSASVGDCVWLYNWTPSRRYCGNPLCGRPISDQEVTTECAKCAQVSFCSGKHCAAVGFLMHHASCSKDSSLPSLSYVMSRLRLNNPLAPPVSLPSLRESFENMNLIWLQGGGSDIIHAPPSSLADC